jgi:DNA polymerase III epsilon subunit-like protein
MKRAIIVIFHLVLIAATNGLWLLVLIPLLIWRKKRESSKGLAKRSQTSKVPSGRYADSKFAQEGGRGTVFTYASLNQGDLVDAPYAIIDLETTGLEKSQHRIIEIAIRRINHDGSLIDEVSTLVDPGIPDVGPTFIHHITPEDVKGAPSFAELAPSIIARLSGCIAVAHHAAFEDGFLGAEFGRLGIALPNIPCIDTLWLARQVIDLPNYKLGTVVNAFGIEEVDAHTALGDVRMLSQLIPLLLQKSGSLHFKVIPTGFRSNLPIGKIKTRVSGLRKGQEGWMANLIKKLPETGRDLTNEVAIAYSEILSKVLSDGKITGEEAKELARFAGSSGLGSSQLEQLHRDYLSAIEKVAKADGVFSESESKELQRIKTQLGL